MLEYGSLERTCQLDGELTPQTAFCAAKPYNYTSLGCYHDADPNRDLTEGFVCNSGMTINMCAAHCENYSYFGVGNGDECRCDNSYGSLGVADNCDVACRGDLGLTCGGVFANSVYRNYGAMNSGALLVN